MAETAMPTVDPGYRNRGNPQDAAKRHDQRECNRKNPYRRGSRHGAPQADRHHGGHMIAPEQRVSKPARSVAAAMGKRRSRIGGPKQQHYRDDWNLPPPWYAASTPARALDRLFSPLQPNESRTSLLSAHALIRARQSGRVGARSVQRVP